MVRADLPGSGKSYACKSMERLGHKVLFVVPTNKLAQNNKDNGVTLNHFFGVGMSSDQKMAKFDDSDFDTIIFDEIYFANIRMLARIQKYAESDPSKIIIATGDTSQVERIDQITNIHEYEK